MALNEEMSQAREVLDRVISNVGTVILGKDEAIELVVLSLASSGHVLIEDVPGTGKTSMVSALAHSISCGYKRIQFTPDIMPSDVTGFSIFNQKTREFEFRPGGVMSNIVLADEINRASAKTQSALLEAMEERQVTVDAQTYRLEEPFMVLATQNPVEQYGTYPLPEAQLDRFLIKLSMGYPDFAQEGSIIDHVKEAKAAIRPVVEGADVIFARAAAEKVELAPLVRDYIVEIVSATRACPDLDLGSSPRGSLALASLSRCYALRKGRSFVLPDDVRYLAPFVLGHRVMLSHEARIAERKPEDIIGSVVSQIAVPYIEDHGEAR